MSNPSEPARYGGRGPTRKTLARAAVHDIAVEFLHQSIPNAFKYDAHTLLCAVYKDPRYPIRTRIDAAKAALPYEKPSLASVKQEVSGPGGVPLAVPTLLIAPFPGKPNDGTESEPG